MNHFQVAKSVFLKNTQQMSKIEQFLKWNKHTKNWSFDQ